MKTKQLWIFTTLFLSLTFLSLGYGTLFSEEKKLLKTRTFKTDFISFNLSNQWNCKMEGSEYVCRPTEKEKAKEALIIIAAKIPGKDDNVKAYYTYLKEPKKIADFQGRTIASKMNVIKYKEIKGTQWVDSIHLSSELRDFYTRYLATVKNGIAILVTYTVARSRHKLYTAELNRMIQSLEVLAKPPQIAGPKPKPVKKLESIITGDRKEAGE
ncbi:MAG: hypothetical protein AAB309_02230 [Deltaproteobacteria bacterium]